MEYNLINNIETCYVEIPQILYYSHIPVIIISLLFGFFVFLKDKRSLLSKILLSISLVFSLYLVFDLILWTTNDGGKVAFLWSLLEILISLFFVLSLYFVYVFIDKKDISFTKKIILGALSIPFVILAPTRFAMNNFDVATCEAVQNDLLINYIFLIEGIVSLWIIVLVITRYIKADKLFKKQILGLSIGISLFLLSFFTSDFIATKLENFKLEQGGFFGMAIFIGFLTYLIVKYKAFNIKLLGAQALVVALVIIIGSQFFFIQNTTNRILTGITFVLVGGFGWFLIRSVKLEVERKDELQLMSNKLAQANDKLRALDNAKSEFISIASHQLRTPLTAIKGFVSLLLEGSYGKLDAKPQEAMNKVYISNERLIHLVEDLLNVSRMESGRMEFKFAPTRMEDLCQEIVETFVLNAKDKNLYLHYTKPATPLPELAIDAGKVKEVVSNIIDNALKYTPKGGVTLRVELTKNQELTTDNKEVIRVIVSDTGIGIPTTELPYLFAKFSRGKDVGRLNVSGTGLGLYVGKAIVEANGGRIWAESDGEGKGSRFIIELPIKQSEELLQRWG